MTSLCENDSNFAEDYVSMIQAVARIIRRSAYSVDQIAELAGIVNEHGDASRHKIYHFWEGTSYPKPGEIKNLIKFFRRANLTACIHLIFNYLFGAIGRLTLLEDENQSNGTLDDDLHYLMIRLGQCAEEIVKANQDQRIDQIEAQRILLALDQLATQIDRAKLEVNFILNQNKRKET